jgi:hypothetical protein
LLKSRSRKGQRFTSLPGKTKGGEKEERGAKRERGKKKGQRAKKEREDQARGHQQCHYLLQVFTPEFGHTVLILV